MRLSRMEQTPSIHPSSSLQTRLNKKKNIMIEIGDSSTSQENINIEAEIASKLSEEESVLTPDSKLSPKKNIFVVHRIELDSTQAKKLIVDTPFNLT